MGVALPANPILPYSSRDVYTGHLESDCLCGLLSAPPKARGHDAHSSEAIGQPGAGLDAAPLAATATARPATS
jgi:hypothetical protein